MSWGYDVLHFCFVLLSPFCKKMEKSTDFNACGASRVCDKFFSTKLVRQFYSSFCSQSKSGTFNNVRCVFILQDAF